MRPLIKKLHMYAGLLTFTAFIVYGIAGLHATFSNDKRSRVFDVRDMDFKIPGGLSDKVLADSVYRLLNLPLTGPIPAFALHRNDAQDLVLNFETPNGVRRVTVLEQANRLRIETERRGLVPYLSSLHSAVLPYAAPHMLTVGWALYNAIATGALFLMAVSGMYLWLASRPRHRLARLAVVVGSASFLALYWWIR